MKHTHTLAWGNHVIRDGGPNGDEPRHVRAGETCRPSSDDLMEFPSKFQPLLKEGATK
jgi:hypothetical protein